MMAWIMFFAYLTRAILIVVPFCYWIKNKVPFLERMGFVFGWKHLIDLISGFVIGAFVMGLIFFMELFTHLIEVKGIDTARMDILIPALGYNTLSAFKEEFLNRCLMYNGILIVLRKPWLAVLFSSMLVGLIHATNPSASSLSVIGNALGGLIYTVAFISSKNVWLPLGLHIGWNYFQGNIFGFPVSGFSEASILNQTHVGNAIITGANYGPEAGIVGIAARFVVLAVVIVYIKHISLLRKRAPDTSHILA